MKKVLSKVKPLLIPVRAEPVEANATLRQAQGERFIFHGIRSTLVLCSVFALAAFVFWLLNSSDDTLTDLPAQTTSTAERGATLAKVGNCAGCHTVRGGHPYAGGLGIDTPFGAVYASNLTPDAATGIGNWTRLDFWRAMHHGKSKDGRLLYPAFPYTSYTLITREDSDALFAYLKSLPAAALPNTPHTVRFPYNTQAALAVWR